MPNILKEIRTCQYDDSIADANGVIQEVYDASARPRNLVSVLPSQENGRKVHTAVTLTSDTAIGQDDADSTRLTNMNDGIGTVQVVRQSTPPNSFPIYGALETVNTGTQRCGVLTKGVVLFRNTGLGPAASSTFRTLPDTALGCGITGPTSNSIVGDHVLDGAVQAAITTFPSIVGAGVILGGIGNYVLVQLEGNALQRPGLLYS